MLNDASGFRRIYLATGYTDLRRGMEGLASIIKFNFQLDPYQKIFCSCSAEDVLTASKGWSGKATASCFYTKTGVGCIQLAPHKRRSIEITPEQYQYLMQGLEIVARHPIQEVRPDKIL